jgi:hypothetical protein
MGRTATETPARAPDDSGYIERDGVAVWWEAYGSGRAILLIAVAGPRIDAADVTPDILAETAARALATPVEYRPIPAEGAARAAALIADLL